MPLALAPSCDFSQQPPSDHLFMPPHVSSSPPPTPSARAADDPCPATSTASETTPEAVESATGTGITVTCATGYTTTDTATCNADNNWDLPTCAGPSAWERRTGRNAGVLLRSLLLRENIDAATILRSVSYKRFFCEINRKRNGNQVGDQILCLFISNLEVAFTWRSSASTVACSHIVNVCGRARDIEV